MNDQLTVRPLGLADASALAVMLREQPDDYMRHFTPFAFDEETVRSILSRREQDVYMGILWADRLVAFFMLRGWDAGYAVPAYGVTVDHRFRGHGLARLSIEMSKSICRLRGVGRLMLKVHPENVVAKRLYEEMGFRRAGDDPRNGNLVYIFDFEPADRQGALSPAGL